jgi:hypothetical protein
MMARRNNSVYVSFHHTTRGVSTYDYEEIKRDSKTNPFKVSRGTTFHKT